MSFLGKLLDIDLSAGTAKFIPFPAELTRRYLGGRGFNAQLLYHNLPDDTDPLGPEKGVTCARLDLHAPVVIRANGACA